MNPTTATAPTDAQPRPLRPHPSPTRGLVQLAPVLALLVAADLLLLAPLDPAPRLPAALTLFVLLPGWLLIETLFGPSGPDDLERGLLALGAGYVLALALPLPLLALFDWIGQAHLLAAANLLVLGLLATLQVTAARQKVEPSQPTRLPLISLGLLLAVAAPLRLWNLGWSEFQGDEAKVVLRAAALLQGLPDALLAHRKPPGELLLQALFSGGLASVTELAGRLPFSLAGLAAVLACYQLGRTLFGPTAGLLAALLLAVNGYFVAFGRILQYQSLALLVDTLAVLCLYRFARGGPGRAAYAVVGALLLSGAALLAFSAVFLLPVAALALWASRRRPDPARWRDLALWLWPLALAALLGLLLLARAGGLDLGGAERYAGARLGWSRLYFNGQGLLLATNLYAGSLYLVGTLGGGLLALLLSRQRGRLGWQLALVWLAGPLLAHLFLVRLVATHWRELYPGLVLLLGAAAAELWSALGRPRLARFARLARPALAATVGLFLVASAHYVFVGWVQPWPEYMLQFPRYRHPLDWTELPVRSAGGTFGAARRHGWKAVAELMAAGRLPTDYATNERPAAAAWYLKRRQTCAEKADLFIRAPTTPRDRDAIEQGRPRDGDPLAGLVLVQDRPGLGLYPRNGATSETYRLPLEPLAERFDARASPWVSVRDLYQTSIDVVPRCRS